MSVQARTLLLIAGAVVMFALGSLQGVPTLLSGTLIIFALALGVMVATVRCPACGERVAKRPSTLFGKSIKIGAPLFHSHCYFCGHDLRRAGARQP